MFSDGVTYARMRRKYFVEVRQGTKVTFSLLGSVKHAACLTWAVLQVFLYNEQEEEKKKQVRVDFNFLGVTSK